MMNETKKHSGRRNAMKKTLSILLVLIMVLGCMTAACAEAEG